MSTESQDLKRITVSLEEGDKGFLLTFPPAPSGSVAIKDRYIFEFDVVFKLPLDPQSTIIFNPDNDNNPSRERYLQSSAEVSPQIGIAIKSIHKAETQTLVRLQIKDIYNNVLYTDYILVICSPQKTFTLRGIILPDFSTEGRGNNGGRILRIDTTGEESVNTASQILTRMRVTGPGIPADTIVTVSSFKDDNRSDVELLPLFTLINSDSSGSIRGLYTFTQISSCPSPEDLREIQFNNRFLVLDKNNNWSYFFREKLVAQFIPKIDISNYEDIAILLEIKNFDALIRENSFSNIPSSALVFAGGRVIGDSFCIEEL